MIYGRNPALYRSYKGRYAPYGYTVKDGEFFINEEEAKWVRYIFEQTLAGKSSNRIAKDLDEKNVPPRKGDHWSPSTVQGILRNEKYVGDCLFQKTYTDFRFKRHINRGDRDQFIVEDHHEALVSREDFEAAGKMLKQHAKEKNVTNGDEKYQRRYPFTKKIICGECGSNFKRRINTTASAKYPVWVCKEHIEHIENCSMKYVKEAALKNAFCTMMNKLIFARTPVLHSLLDAVRSQNHKESLLRVNTINTELEGLGEHRQTLISIMTKGYIDRAAYTREMNALTTEAASLEAERERLTKEVSGDMKKTEGLREILKYTGKGEMLSEFDAALFERFVDHITVCSREEVIFHLSCGLDLRERIG